MKKRTTIGRAVRISQSLEGRSGGAADAKVERIRGASNQDTRQTKRLIIRISIRCFRIRIGT